MQRHSTFFCYDSTDNINAFDGIYVDYLLSLKLLIIPKNCTLLIIMGSTLKAIFNYLESQLQCKEYISDNCIYH